MFVEIIAITAGLILAYFLKDIQFLSINLEFLNTGLIYPDFLLIFILFFALHRSAFVALWIGFFGGLLEDGTNWVFHEDNSSFTAIIGVHSFVYTLMAYIMGVSNSIFEKYQSMFIFLLIFFIVILSRSCIWFLHGLVDQLNMNYPILGAAFYTAIVSPLSFSFLSWVYRISKTNQKN